MFPNTYERAGNTDPSPPNPNERELIMTQQVTRARRVIVPAAIAAAVLVAFGGYTLSNQPAAAKGQAPGLAIPVSTAQVLERPVTAWDEFSGRVEAVERVEIRPRVSGAIEAVHFQEGQIVKRGDLLFTIDPRPYEAEVARAEAAVVAAEARQTLASTQFERSERLLAERAIAQREYDERQNALREAQASLHSARAALQTAKLDLEFTRVRAPVAGRVSRAEITEGNVINAGPGAQVLTTVVSVSPIYVGFQADERTLLRLQASAANGPAPVSVGLADEPGYPHGGRIKALDNRIDPQSGTIRLRAEFENPDGKLIPGMFARVRLASSGMRRALLVNDRAIGTDQDKKFVMVVGTDKHVAYREVALGPVVDGLRVVQGGLHAGEWIVVNGLQHVRPGDAVSPTTVAMDAQASTTAQAAASPDKSKKQG